METTTQQNSILRDLLIHYQSKNFLTQEDVDILIDKADPFKTEDGLTRLARGLIQKGYYPWVICHSLVDYEKLCAIWEKEMKKCPGCGGLIFTHCPSCLHKKSKVAIDLTTLILYCREMGYITEAQSNQMKEFFSATEINPFAQPEFLEWIAYGLKQRGHTPKDISVINQELLQQIFSGLDTAERCSLEEE